MLRRGLLCAGAAVVGADALEALGAAALVGLPMAAAVVPLVREPAPWSLSRNVAPRPLFGTCSCGIENSRGSDDAVDAVGMADPTAPAGARNDSISCLADAVGADGASGAVDVEPLDGGPLDWAPGFGVVAVVVVVVAVVELLVAVAIL